MASTPHEFPTLSSYLGLDEELDYGSDVDVHGDERTLSNPPVSEARPFSAPNSLVERIETIALMTRRHAINAGEHIITNPLEKQQALVLQQKETSRRRAHTKKSIQSHSDYVISAPDV